MNLDKFGYYQVGNYKTYSKFEAMELSGLSKTRWVFNDDVFSSFDWSICPEQSINELYDKRAKEIREQYDYIVLFYSGGYDSHNILKTFIDNKIHIDEIITMIPSKDILSPLTIEYNLFTKNRLEKYSPFLKNTKIRLIEYKEILIEIFKDGRDILYDMNTKYAPNNLVSEKFKEKLIEHSNNVISGKKMAYIFGIDKPVINYDNGKFYVVFDDYIIANKVLPSIQRDKIVDVCYEFFYWDPSCVNLLIKQAHLLKENHKNKFYGHQKYVVTDNLKIYPRCIEDEIVGYFDASPFRDMYRKLYLKNNVSEIMCGGGRDYWFYVKQDEMINRIKSSINYMQDKFKNDFIKKNNKTTVTKQFKIKYYIGE